MSQNAQLIDEIRALEAQVHGKRMELSMALGDRAQAEFHRREMYAMVEARRAAAELAVEKGASCYFLAKGHVDGLAMEASRNA